ncbi:MAG: hypothetical protein ACWGSQ_01875 [Longimicrobiales bacterium]
MTAPPTTGESPNRPDAGPGFVVPGLFVPGFVVPGLFVPGFFVPGFFVPGFFVPALHSRVVMTAHGPR